MSGKGQLFPKRQRAEGEQESVFRVGYKTMESMDRNRYSCDTAGDRSSDTVAQAGTKGPVLHLNDTPGPMDRCEIGQGH